MGSLDFVVRRILSHSKHIAGIIWNGSWRTCLLFEHCLHLTSVSAQLSHGLCNHRATECSSGENLRDVYSYCAFFARACWSVAQKRALGCMCSADATCASLCMCIADAIWRPEVRQMGHTPSRKRWQSRTPRMEPRCDREGLCYLYRARTPSMQTPVCAQPYAHTWKETLQL
jgi:hypothetical protein